MEFNTYLIGKRIKGIRTRQQMSQATLAELIDKTPTYISYLENGMKSMSLETLIAIANALKATPDDLLYDHIDNPTKVENHELAEILDGCTPFEKKVIIDTARSLKATMREFRFLLKKRN